MKDMKFMKGGKERVQEGSKEHRAESIGKTTTATAPFRVQGSGRRGAGATKQSPEQFKYREIASLRSKYSMLHALCPMLSRP
ncbi:MAG TPA: hypothetical protein PK636_08365 [bacterium]|nr:hypothetical protein [bacterium]